MRQLPLIAGADATRTLDALFINAPLRDYTRRPRTNDYTLPVLGMAYIATHAQQQGFNVGVLDAEAHGLGVEEAARIVNEAAPRWAAMNLLAPTYEMSAKIAARLDPGIDLMVGGHHAKAMPDRILNDPRMRHLRALVLGEGELRVAALLEDLDNRRTLPGVLWRDPLLGTRAVGIASPKTTAALLGPDINALPYVNRGFLPQDPYQARRRPQTSVWPANVRGSAPAGTGRPTSSAAEAAPTTARSAAPLSPPTRTSPSACAPPRASSVNSTSCTTSTA